MKRLQTCYTSAVLTKLALHICGHPFFVSALESHLCRYTVYETAAFGKEGQARHFPFCFTVLCMSFVCYVLYDAYHSRMVRFQCISRE